MLDKVFGRTPMWVYGHSFAQPNGEMCDPGEEWMPKLADRLGLHSWTTFGVGSSRLIDIYADIAGSGYAKPNASSMWSTSRDGFVVLQGETNDFISPAFGGVAEATGLSGKQITNYASTLASALALLSASQIIDMNGGSAGGSWSSSGGPAYGGGANAYTTQHGAYREFNVDVGPSGVVWVICWDVSTDIGNDKVGEMTVYLNGSPWYVAGAKTAPWQTIYSRRSGERGVGPRAIKLSGLPMGVQTLRFTKTDTGPGAVYLDRIAVQGHEGPPIFVTKDPMHTVGTSWVADLDTRVLQKRNRVYLHGKIDEVVSQFPNAVAAYISGMTSSSFFGPDGVHPSNTGMTYLAETLERTVRTFASLYAPDRMFL